MNEDDLSAHLNSLPTPSSRANKKPTEQSLQHKYDQIRGSDSSHITGIKPKSKSMATASFSTHPTSMSEDFADVMEGLQSANDLTGAPTASVNQNSGFYAIHSADELMDELNNLLHDEQALHPTVPRSRNHSPGRRSTNTKQANPVPNPLASIAAPTTGPVEQPVEIHDPADDELAKISGYTPAQLSQLDQAVASGDYAALSRINPKFNTASAPSKLAAKVQGLLPTSKPHKHKGKLKTKAPSDPQHIDFLADSADESADCDEEDDDDAYSDTDDVDDHDDHGGARTGEQPGYPRLHNEKPDQLECGDDDVMAIINQVYESNNLEQELEAMQTRFELADKLTKQQQAPPPASTAPNTAAPHQPLSGVEYYQQVHANAGNFLVPTDAQVKVDELFDDLFE